MSDVSVTYDPADTITLSPAQREEMEGIIREKIQLGQRIDRYEDGSMPPLYRLCRYHISSDGKLHMVTGRTDFGEYLLTNVEHPEWRAQYGKDAMSDALAFSAVVMTKDRYALWGLRSQRTADGAKRCHVLPSGHAHPPESLPNSVLLELTEETGIQSSEVIAAACTGFVVSLWNGKPELTYWLEVTPTFQDVLRLKPVDAWEFEEIHGLRWTEDEVLAWLRERLSSAVGPGHAAISLAARRAFGSDWWSDAVGTFLMERDK